MGKQIDLRLEEDRREEVLLRSVSAHAIIMLDTKGQVSTWNRGACIATGYTEQEILGRNISIFYRLEDQATTEPQKALQVASELGHYESEGWRVRKDGECFWASVVIDAVYNGKELVGFAKITRDISLQHETEERRIRANRNLEIALTHMCQGLVLYDSSGEAILFNKRLGEIFSIASDKICIGMSITDVMSSLGFSPNRAMKMQRELASLVWCDHLFHSRQKTTDGRVVVIATRHMPEGGWVSTFEDVTEREQADSQLLYMQCHDALTNLTNRQSFRARLQQAVNEVKRGIPFALLLLDIKDFHAINDAMGEGFGDEVLRSVARRIREHSREVDCLARLDGDEFALLQCNPKLPGDTEVLASRLMKCFSIPHEVRGQSLVVRVNIGIVLGVSNGPEVTELLHNVDLALRRAKQSPSPSYNFFDPEMDRLLQTRRALEHDLSRALELGELTLHYQPIVDARTCQTRGYEVLLRWCHPSRGLISPAEFIPIAEESGHIVAIGEWVLRTACRQAVRWEMPLNIAVNVSSVQFQNGSLPALVADVLATTGLRAERLELEITESLLLKADVANLDILSRLENLGVRLSLDDFGTGFSSLSYLSNFHFDKLKIDRSFVRDLPDSASSKSIVAAIVGLGRSFGMLVVAEGVETDQQLLSLQQQGCDELQGYYLGRPQSAEALFGIQTDHSLQLPAARAQVHR